MKNLSAIVAGIIIPLLALPLGAQTSNAYEHSDTISRLPKGLLDPSRFTIHHSVSFGAAAGAGSSLKSQSIYSTMIRYRLSEPLTLNLNFGMPIHSTAEPRMNLSNENLQSLDYFKNMPLDFSLVWAPKQNFMMRVGVFKLPQESSLFAGSLFPLEREDFWRPW